ncbi:hypothetical protein PLICRDRAFT_697396 [Plicaturopsis crispa FD-325 SS-3]|nr:hypothetical protein PLICRDRAFT_697396 [Plicaturopsis crispa FD-325 SS-3]
MSPLKSTFTTSMGHRYLNDIAALDPSSLTVATKSCLTADPHTPDDKIQARITMAEATDDSYIFTIHLSATTPFLWNAFNMPTDGAQTGRKLLQFLRTKVDDPTARYEELRDFIDDFTFPKLNGRPPVTLLRKIVSQNIISRVRALLALQPIKQIDAVNLDNHIMTKVHDILGLPFRMNGNIANQPVGDRGFDFPSISRINQSIAVEGLGRDLNHQIRAYRDMARITLADWTCDKNGCIYPLDGEGLRKDFSHFAKSIPAAWILAQKAMASLAPKLSLRATDMSWIAQGDVSLSHITRLHNHHMPKFPDSPDGNTIRSLRSKGVRTLADIGQWTVSQSGDVVFIPKQIPVDVNGWSPAALTNYAKITNVASNLDIAWLVNGPADLLLPPTLRQTKAERLIAYLSRVCGFRASPTSGQQQIWGSDGSMTPASVGIGDDKSVTASITGPCTLVMKLKGRNLNILHGELMGLISGLVLADSTLDVPRIYSDHMNATRFLDDAKSRISQDARLKNMNGRSYYRWILSLRERSRAQMIYTPGHSDEVSIPSLLNSEADFYASESQRHLLTIPVAPSPTFFMDTYTFYRERDGWIESNIRHFVDFFLAKQTALSLASSHPYRMYSPLHDNHPPPSYPYTHAQSAHSATIQLYARSGQLPTADVLFRRDKLIGDRCRFGCETSESAHHIFVECPRYTEWRRMTADDVVGRTRMKLAEQEVPEPAQQRLLHTAKSLFCDDECWPFHQSLFYYGQLPPLPALLPQTEMSYISRKRLLHHLAADWHTSAIRLAGRIFGDLQREMARRAG